LNLEMPPWLPKASGTSASTRKDRPAERTTGSRTMGLGDNKTTGPQDHGTGQASCRPWSFAEDFGKTNLLAAVASAARYVCSRHLLPDY